MNDHDRYNLVNEQGLTPAQFEDNYARTDCLFDLACFGAPSGKASLNLFKKAQRMQYQMLSQARKEP